MDPDLQGQASSYCRSKKTQLLLKEIERGIYNINPNEISFEIYGHIRANDKLFDRYNDRLRNALKKYREHPNLPLPKGLQLNIPIDEKGKKLDISGFMIEPGSAFYPDPLIESNVFAFLSKTGLICFI